MTFEDLKVEWNTPAKHRVFLRCQSRSRQISDNTAEGFCDELSPSRSRSKSTLPLFALSLFEAIATMRDQQMNTTGKMHGGFLCTYLLVLEKQTWPCGLAELFHVKRLLAVEVNMSPNHHKCCDGKQPFHPAMFVQHSTEHCENDTSKPLSWISDLPNSSKI